MRIQKQLNKDGTVYYLATGKCGSFNFVAEGETRGEAFKSALVLIRENGIKKRLKSVI